MDLLQRISIVVGGDASNAKKVLREVSKEVDTMAKTSTKGAAKAGKDIGDTLGTGLTTSTKKHMNAVSTIMSRFFGQWGRQASGIVQTIKSIAEARDAAAREIGGRIGGSVAGEAAASSFTGEAAGTALGVRLAVKGPEDAVAIGKRIKSEISRSKAKQLAAIPVGMGARARALKDMGLDPNDPEAAMALQRRIDRKTRVGRFFRETSATGTGHMGTVSAMGGGITGKGMMAAGGMAAGATLAAAAAIGVGLVATMGILSRKYDELKKKQDELFGKEGLIKEIDAIKDPVERTEAILKKFGEDGLAKFRELRTEVQKLKDDIGSEDWKRSVTAANMAWTAMKDFWSNNVWKPMKETASSALSSVLTFATRISKEMIEDMEVGEARIRDMQKRLDDAQKKRVEDKKIQLEIDKEIEARRISQLSKEKHLYEIQDKILELQINKNRTLEQELTLQRLLTQELQIQRSIGDTPSIPEWGTPIDPKAEPVLLGPSLKDAGFGTVGSRGGVWSTSPPEGQPELGIVSREYGPTEAPSSVAERIMRQREEAGFAITAGRELAAENLSRGRRGMGALAGEELREYLTGLRNKMAGGDTDAMSEDTMEADYKVRGSIAVRPVMGA